MLTLCGLGIYVERTWIEKFQRAMEHQAAGEGVVAEAGPGVNAAVSTITDGRRGGLEKDEESVQTMQAPGRNMAWLLKKLKADAERGL